MINGGPGPRLRRYGSPPYRLAVVHGGPGATGEAAPVARRLSRLGGVLEPLQTADSVSGQIDELAACLDAEADGPVTLIGHSWGAWLGVLVAGRRPDLVAKLILVGSGPFLARDAPGVMKTRLGRLEPSDRQEIQAFFTSGTEPDQAAVVRLTSLLKRTDAYDPLPAGEDAQADPPCVFAADIQAKVWPEAAALRQSGELLRIALSLSCPITAIHGDYDPHPVAGVREPLSGVSRFRMIVLPRCGHTPWRERQAREAFFEVLASAIRGEAIPG
ncbi:alpha/beta hydrolase fold protein [Solidesulfovibrio fructosivorans JJ]]|uniref:Alpha/beta hydrolase fold protein n=1 Tax=Solidesulfovibrio fructosivorans JJ] TaxID=596151 RepID=E1JWE1_SOLFR|nr:alpha/beta hydrolase [Solidesulfovibrio fructosivorans]EFL51238.1 alpha/beta hydrolase fold protein [Solidesulfovibrio fructosivorans JJ]]